MMDDKKKGGLSLIIGMGKPGGKGGKDEPMGDDEGREACGKALIVAIKRGDGAGVMDALEECYAHLDGDHDTEEDEEEEPEEE